MKDLTPSIDTQVTMSRGTVVRREQRGVEVAIGPMLVQAQLAPSCLLQPEPGDRVLVVAGLIVTITARAEGTSSGTAILASAAPLRITAPRIDMEARELHLRGNETTISAERLSLVGRTLDAAAGAIKWVATTIDQFADRVSSSAQTHSRNSHVRDDVTAGAASMRCEGVLDTRAGAVTMIGSEVVKVDGGQIQLG